MTIVVAIADPLAFPFFVRALLASTIVGLVCAVVGSYMVLRGLAFMGDALSHSAFPGVVAAYLLKGPFYLGAAIAAVGTALAIGWVTRRGNLRGDTTIGVLFAGMFALGIFLFSLIPNYVGDLFGFLFGEILGIGLTDLLALAGLAVVVLATVGLLWKELLYATFDPLGAAASGLPVGRLDYLFLGLIALTIVISLQAVGIILVVAMLVTPAATGQLVARSFGRLVVVAIAIGIASPIAGLYLSYWLNAASGATIVLVETGVFIVALVVTSSRRASRAAPGPGSSEPRTTLRRPTPRR
jgi:manganese/iron transport system permease protein